VAVALFSAAVSLKMNVLLMAPPVLMVLLRVRAEQCRAVESAGICVAGSW
jgi:ALG3 protein